MKLINNLLPCSLTEINMFLNESGNHNFVAARFIFYQKLSNEQLFSTSYFEFRLKILY